MTDSDDLKRRARELCEANSENRGDPCSTEHEILPALLARIEALEAERDGWRTTAQRIATERDNQIVNALRSDREADTLRARLAKYERVVESIRFDIDKAIGAHDPVDPRHRSHGGQHHNGPCCVLGNVPPGQIRTLREWRDALESAGKDRT